MAKGKTALVIVESPAKARTIEKYLGRDFKVVASMGPSARPAQEHDGRGPGARLYAALYPRQGQGGHHRGASRARGKSGHGLPRDRPGPRGRSHRLAPQGALELPDERACRVTFNEITKKVVTESINEPREIDIDLVDAQQARRILDRIVGYELSPLLWKKIRRGLSAGRVQSVATRMVVDRENEIRAFVPEEYWLLDAVLRRADGSSFTARYYGEGKKKTELKNEAQADAVIADCRGGTFTIDSVKRGKKERSPSPPFITSTLQQ